MKGDEVNATRPKDGLLFLPGSADESTGPPVVAVGGTMRLRTMTMLTTFVCTLVLAPTLGRAQSEAGRKAKARQALATVLARKVATVDPNADLEVRGQTRTLSMLLTLKNGQDGIDFIKVRQNYRPEIKATPY